MTTLKKVQRVMSSFMHVLFRTAIYTITFEFFFYTNCLLAQIPSPSTGGSAASSDSRINPSNPMRGSGMCFTPNKGQIIDMDKNLRPDVLYVGDGGGATVYLRKTGISYVLNNAATQFHETDKKAEEKKMYVDMTREQVNDFKLKLMDKTPVQFHRIDVDFIGANPNPTTIASDPLDGYNNYYLGHCPEGITHVSSYNNVTEKNIYPNIDVKYYGGKDASTSFNTRKGLKYDIVINQGGNPSQIKLKYSGAQNILLEYGKLQVETSLGTLGEYIPKVYQNINGKIVDVECKYKLDVRCEMLDLRGRCYGSQSHISCLKSHIYEVSFELGTYNLELPLVIDPWATYYSGSAQIGMQSGGGLCADGSGNVIFTGQSGVTDMPVSPGAFQTTLGHGGGLTYNAFLVKFTITGMRVFGTYFGGVSLGGFGSGVAADGNNDILLCGLTASSNFPTKNPGGGAYFQSVNSGRDAFVAKFTPAGLLIWSTLYGGSGTDEADDVITDAANNVIIVGYTYSADFPTQAPYQATLSGTQDAFVVKFNSGCVRQWATYYGGTSTEQSIGVACDASNNIFFTGNTSSANFPLVAAFQGAAGGGTTDAFVVKLNGNNGFPLWSTYYGGSMVDEAAGVAVDTPGNCIITGVTGSVNNIASGGANQTVNGGGGDAFLAKFGPTGTRLWGTYHGGINGEKTGSCAVDSKNNIYWYGEVEDAQPNPSWISTCAYQNTYNGTEDHLISSFDPNGKLLCTTAVGGPGEEDYDAGIVLPHYDITAFDPFLYITAHVRGGGYPVSAGAFQTIPAGMNGGGIDAFVNQLCLNICQQQFLGTTATASQTIICPNTPITFSSSVNNACDTTGLRFKWTFTGATPNSSTIPNPVISYSSPGYYSVKLVVSTPCQKDSVIKTNYIIVNPCTINANASTATICSGTCTNMTASGSSGTAPYTYSWSTGGTTATINVCPTTTTDYTVKITDANGNYAATTTTVFVHPLLSMTSTSTNATCNTNGNASVTVSNGTAPYTYTWSSGQTSTVSGYAPGNYTVTVTDAKGCTLTKSFNLTSSSPVTASFSYTPPCIGSVVNFTNTGTSGAGVTYNWTISPITPSNVSGTTADFSYTFLTAGSYTVLYQAFSGGCLATISKIINVTNCSGPTITTSTNPICINSCATVTSTPTGGSTPYTYSWSTGATSKDIAPCPTSSTTYTVKVTDSGGNTATSTATVTVRPAISANATFTSINCSGGTGSATATGSSGTSPYTFNWSTGATTTGASSTLPNLPANTYSVVVSDANGCTTTTSVTLVSPPPLLGQFTKGTATCANCGCQEWALVNATGGTAPYVYQWPDNYDKRYKNKICPGNYTVKVTDKNGCSVDVSVSTP